MFSLGLPCNNFLSESIISFSMGVLLSYWSYGFIYFILWILGYEFLYIFYLIYKKRIVYPICRTVVLASSFLGWITGRTICKVSCF